MARCSWDLAVALLCLAGGATGTPLGQDTSSSAPANHGRPAAEQYPAAQEQLRKATEDRESWSPGLTRLMDKLEASKKKHYIVVQDEHNKTEVDALMEECSAEKKAQGALLRTARRTVGDRQKELMGQARSMLHPSCDMLLDMGYKRVDHPRRSTDKASDHDL